MNHTQEELEQMTAFRLENHHRYINNVLGNAKHIRLKVLFPDSINDKENDWRSVLPISYELQEELRKVVVENFKKQKEMIAKEWRIKEEEERQEFFNKGKSHD